MRSPCGARPGRDRCADVWVETGTQLRPPATRCSSTTLATPSRNPYPDPQTQGTSTSADRLNHYTRADAPLGVTVSAPVDPTTLPGGAPVQPNIRAILGVALASSVISPAQAQTCTTAWWVAATGLQPRLNAIVPLTFAEYDADGPGPAGRELYVGGFFSFAGDSQASANIARWDGVRWTGASTGVGGSGIDTIWDSTVWDPDGPGQQMPILVIGGLFASAAGEYAVGVAAWNGQHWAPVGGGVDSIVFCVTTHDFDGNGPTPPELIVGGSFNSAGGIPAASVARFNGTRWLALERSINPGQQYGDNFTNLHSFDPDGTGPMLPTLFAKRGVVADEEVVRLVGDQWESTELFSSSITTIFGHSFVEVDHDGSGPDPKRLYCAGPGLHLWSNSSWITISTEGDSVAAAHDPDGPGPAPTLVVFRAANTLRTYDGNVITNLTPPANFIGKVWSLTSFDPDGPGPMLPSLFIGNEHLQLGGAPGSSPTNVFSQGLARYGCSIEWARCYADATQDLRVNMTDLTTVLVEWGGNNPVADVNNDQVVGMTDVSAVLNTYGEDCNEPAPDASRSSIVITDFTEFQRRLLNSLPPHSGE